MRFFSSISVINIVKSKRILLKMRIKTDVAVTVLNRYCDITASIKMVFLVNHEYFCMISRTSFTFSVILI